MTTKSGFSTTVARMLLKIGGTIDGSLSPLKALEEWAIN
jgi:hypothetical protein